MQKAKIEEDFTEKARLVQMELEKEREKAKSEKEKYETEKAKLEHERKKLEQLQLEIQEREERISTPITVTKTSTDSDKDLNSSEVAAANHISQHSSSSSLVDPSNTSFDLVTGTADTNVAGFVNHVHPGSELHETLHGQATAMTNTQLLETEKQLVFEQERLDAMQQELSEKMSNNHTKVDSSQLMYLLNERKKVDEQQILLEKAKFSAENKERYITKSACKIFVILAV